MPMSMQPPRSILIFRSGAVGDLILTTPVLASLRSAYPEATIQLVGNPSRAALARHLVNGVCDLDDAEWASLFSAEPRLESSAVQYVTDADLIVNYLPDRDGIFTTNLVSLCPGRVLSHPPHPAECPPVHIIDHLLRALDALGIGLLRSPSVSHLSCGIDIPKPYLVTHPGSGGSHKTWPVERFAAACGLLSTQTNVVVSSGPADDARMAEMRRLLPDAAYPDPLALDKLAHLYGCASLYIGNDSGPTHLAAATGIPTIALFGPTDPAVWGPVGKQVYIVEGDRSLAPTERLASIEIDSILELANQLISKEIH